MRKCNVSLLRVVTAFRPRPSLAHANSRRELWVKGPNFPSERKFDQLQQVLFAANVNNLGKMEVTTKISLRRFHSIVRRFPPRSSRTCNISVPVAKTCWQRIFPLLPCELWRADSSRWIRGFQRDKKAERIPKTKYLGRSGPERHFTIMTMGEKKNCCRRRQNGFSCITEGEIVDWRRMGPLFWFIAENSPSLA